jgi:hypothetical protein
MGTNGRLRASAIGARRGSSLLLFAAALVASAVLALGGSASPAGAADSAGGVCGGVATTAPVTAQASADPITAGGIAKWLAIKGTTVLGEKAAGFGMEALMRAIGLNSLLPDAEILANLDEIKAQLSGISGQLDGINKSVNQVIAEARKIQLDGVLTNLCSIAAKQEVAFEQDYLPMIEAGTELAHVLAGPNPGQADVKDPATGLSLRERVQKLRDGFVTNYGRAQNTLEAGIKELHSALVPGSVRTSALAVYGKVLMTKRFVGRSDSELLRQLYAGLAEVRAIAALMAAEYRSSEPANRTALNNVLRGFLEGRREETQSLPPMIPSGAVIDLSGSTSEPAPATRSGSRRGTTTRAGCRATGCRRRSTTSASTRSTSGSKNSTSRTRTTARTPKTAVSAAAGTCRPRSSSKRWSPRAAPPTPTSRTRL